MERIELNDDDVISVQDANASLTGQMMNKLFDLKQKTSVYIQKPLNRWIERDLDCEVLRVQGGGWIKGKIRARIVIEFIPDEMPLSDTHIANSGSEADNLIEKFNS